MKKKYSIYILSMILMTAKLCAADLEDVAEAAQFLNAGVKEVGLVSFPCKDQTKAITPQHQNPLTVKDASDILLVHEVKTSDEYQRFFKKAPEIEPTDSNPFYISVVFQNDKRFLYEQMAKEKSDDVGRTHGLEIHLGKESKDGVTKDLSITSSLYTEKIRNLFDENGNPVRYSKSGEKLQFSHYENGEGVYLNSKGERVSNSDITLKPQHFQEVNTIDFLVDNIKQGDTVYYKAGAGIVMLVSDKQTSFGAAAQQHKWHEFTGKTVYTNIGDGQGDRFGVSVLGALGLQKKLENKKLDMGIASISYEIKAAMEVGAKGDTLLGNKVWGKATSGIGLGREVRKGERVFEVTASHEEGKSQLKKIELALNGKDCSIFVSYNYYKNDEKKYAPLEEGTMNMGSKCHF